MVDEIFEKLYKDGEHEYTIYINRFGKYAVKVTPYAWLPKGFTQDRPIACKWQKGSTWRIDGVDIEFDECNNLENTVW